MAVTSLCLENEDEFRVTFSGTGAQLVLNKDDIYRMVGQLTRLYMKWVIVLHV